MNIVLIGYRGCGKTTIGPLLARALEKRGGWKGAAGSGGGGGGGSGGGGGGFVDVDVLIVERAGKTIAEIFSEGGEERFRDLESAVVADVAGRDGLVIAAGGGAVLRGENVKRLKERGKVVWLRATPEVLHQRILADTATATNRPNLTAGGGLEEVRTLLAMRTPLYEAAADVTLDVGELSVEQAVERVLEWVRTLPAIKKFIE